MSEGPRDVDGTVETHSLLLSLAGVLDDELLGWCRELVAVGESDYAIELVTGAVQAERIRLPKPVYDQLLTAANRRQLLGRSEPLPEPDPSPRFRHRFLADPTAGGFPPPLPSQSPEQALRGVPVRLLRNCQLRLSWRATPAGSAAGPLPHPVVLIEAAETEGADVLAYQVGEVLARAGVFASVEVFPAGSALGDYHRAALAESRPVDLTDSLGVPSRPEVPRSEPEGLPRENNAPRDLPRLHGGPSGVDGTTRATGRAPLRPVDPPRGSTQMRAHGGGGGGVEEMAAGTKFDQSPRAVNAPEQLEATEPSAAPANEPPADRSRPSARELAAASAEESAGSSGTVAFPTNGERNEEHRPANRPAAREEELPEPPPGLSDVEQRLLRQLHEELAAREGNESSPTATRAFGGTNGHGGRSGRPPRSLGGPPDRAS